jgi:polyketide biosynthesis 3-hydroxy-3-methylglutaryl-CoA synthase-like enzyme PksG
MALHTPLLWLVRQAHRALVQGDTPEATDVEIDASFERMIGPSLRYTRIVGNTYSGCVFFSLIGVLDSLQESDDGARVGMFSYGSGASAEVFSGTVAAKARCVMSRRGIDAMLAARHELSVSDLDEAAAAIYDSVTEPAFVPDRDAGPWRYDKLYASRGRLVLDRVDDYFRHYVRS